jgi:hypothetical protein
MQHIYSSEYLLAICGRGTKNYKCYFVWNSGKYTDAAYEYKVQTCRKICFSISKADVNLDLLQAVLT